MTPEIIILKFHIKFFCKRKKNLLNPIYVCLAQIELIINILLSMSFYAYIDYH